MVRGAVMTVTLFSGTYQRRKPSQPIDTAVGRVDATALEELPEHFDTQQELLELVDALDEWRGRIGDPDGLRVDVLRLHAMAHTLVNGAPLMTNVENLVILELANAWRLN
jgi:hypothetical protein